jgi:anti-anti-sigma factor
VTVSGALVPPLGVAVQEQGRWVVVRVRGELTSQTCEELTGVLAGVGVGGGPGCVAVDTTGLEFFDEAGLRCLVLACRRVRRAGGEFVVVDAGPVMRKAARMALGEYLPVAAELPA